MAKWYRVTLRSRVWVDSTVTFGAIGWPYSFTSAPLEKECWTEWVYRCFEKPEGNEKVSTLAYLPYELRERKRDEGEEVFEDGWYLSGVGHHELWCGSTLEEAVDAAQEHIAWDGSDPTTLSPTPARTNPDGTLSHLLTTYDS